MYSMASLKEKIGVIVLFSLVAVVVLAPLSLFNNQLPTIFDYFNHIAGILQANLAFSEGQFPLRVAPLGFEGWRYPYFQFYSPMSYTIASFIYKWLMPQNPFVAFKTTIWIFLVIGGIYISRLAFWFTKSKPASLLAGVAYLVSPYYLIVINHIGAFNEANALGLLPAVIYYTIQRYQYPNKNKILLQTSFAWFLLATIHLITFVYASIFCGLLLFIITIRHPMTSWFKLINTGIAYGFGCILALWHLGPIFMLSQGLIIHRTLTNAIWHSFYDSSLATLLSPYANISNVSGGVLMYNDGIFDIESMIHPNINLPIVIGILFCFNALFQKKKLPLTNRALDWMPALLIVISLIFLCILTPISFWQKLPSTFHLFQYPWRLLSQTLWIGVLLFAFALCFLFNNQLSEKHVGLGILLIVLSASSWFSTPEISRMEFKDIIKHPIFPYNKDSYLLDIQQNPQWISMIDTFSILPLITNTKEGETLVLNKPYKIDVSLLQVAANLQISLQGSFPATNTAQSQLVALINNKIIATLSLKEGPFQWNFPLSQYKNKKINQPLILEFKLQGVNTQTTYLIHLNKIELNGFIPYPTLISVDKVTPFCHQQKENTLCQIPISQATQWLALPIYFYPDLLLITLNNKPVPYFGILYKNHLITGINAIPGQMNTVNIQFRGLLWANTLSSMGWGLWGLFFVYIMMQKFPLIWTRIFHHEA